MQAMPNKRMWHVKQSSTFPRQTNPEIIVLESKTVFPLGQRFSKEHAGVDDRICCMHRIETNPPRRELWSPLATKICAPGSYDIYVGHLQCSHLRDQLLWLPEIITVEDSNPFSCGPSAQGI